MNRRNLFLAALIIIIIFIVPVAATWQWSICDEAASPGCADSAKAQGFWNFRYDDAAPYTTAGLYCCWWERWYKWQKFSTWNQNTNTMNLGSSDGIPSPQVETESFTPASAAETSQETAPVKASPTLTQIQPEDGYCPSCCSICDDDTASALQTRSDMIMAKKPWLTEGKSKTTTTAAAVTAVPTTVAQISFSEAK